MFFHALPTLLPGGFVGVDVFFVISGFLITGIILDDVEAGNFSFYRFYERRARRLFPALGIVLAATIIIGWFVLLPKAYADLAKSAIATVLFVSNIFFAQDVGYFAGAAETKPLLHTWSLGVEEQFYLVFPLLVVAVSRFSKRLELWLLAIALLSFGAMMLAMDGHREMAFYAMPTRVWELLVGSLTCLASRRFRISRSPREVLGFLGLGGIGLAVMTFSKNTPFPGVAALLPCIGAAAFLLAGGSGTCIPAAILSLRPLVFVGKISYALYLWHWPLLVLARARSEAPLTQLESFSAIAIAAVAATASTFLIENPIRRRQFLPHPVGAYGLSLVGTSVILIAAFAIVATAGLPQRKGSEIAALLVENDARATQFSFPQDCRKNWRAHKSDDVPLVECVLGDAGSRQKVLFWGDSHVEHLYSAAQMLAEDGISSVMVSAGSCPPIANFEWLSDGYCSTFNRKALARASAADISVVAINGFWVMYLHHLHQQERICIGTECRPTRDEEDVTQYFSATLERQVRELRKEGKRVIVMLPLILFDMPIPHYLSVRLLQDRPIGKLSRQASHMEVLQPMDAAIRGAALRGGAEVLDPKDAFCDKDGCSIESGGLALFKDSNHLTDEGARRIYPLLRCKVSTCP